MGNFNFVLYFIVFAVLVKYFSKNMTIVLGIPLILINLMALKGYREGMETNTGTDNKNKPVNPVLKPSPDSNKPDPVSSQGLIMSSISNTTQPENTTQSENNTQGEKQGFEAGRRKNRQYNIDYATTIEDAYDELNNILGSDGIQKLTNDTQNLMKQQMQLAGTMKDMGKLVENIQPMVGQLQQMMGNNSDGSNGLLALAKNLTNQTKPAN
jgi:hypothetical protein